jgi:hypothetical protein
MEVTRMSPYIHTADNRLVSTINQLFCRIKRLEIAVQHIATSSNTTILLNIFQELLKAINTEASTTLSAMIGSLKPISKKHAKRKRYRQQKKGRLTYEKDACEEENHT